jgi:hypothetical protein
MIAKPIEGGLDVGLELGERRDCRLLGGFDVGRGHVQLGAVARREADGLAAGRREPLREIGGRVVAERDTLAQLDRRVMVRGADENEAHQEK